jgi:hypothetical protein
MERLSADKGECAVEGAVHQLEGARLQARRRDARKKGASAPEVRHETKKGERHTYGQTYKQGEKQRCIDA